jgi:multidrug resistance efflux pump
MIAPSEVNTVASSFALSSSVAVEESPVDTSEQCTAPKVAGVSVSGAADTSRLIDWNIHHPDGSEATLKSLLESCSKLIGAEIFVGRTAPSGGVTQVVSSHQAWSTNRPATRFHSSILEASLASQACIVASEETHRSGVLNHMRQSEGYRLVVGFALSNSLSPHESPVGVLVCEFLERPANCDLVKVSPQIRSELSLWMQTWLASRKVLSKKSWGTSVAWVKKYRKPLSLAFLSTTALIAFAPAPYWPQRECVVEPAERRFVASPIDGRMLKSLVRPGDVVTIGQVIGQLDDEHLRWELGAAEAELQAAIKHRDSALAHKEGGKLRLAQFEQQQIALKIQSLQAQLNDLELRSPVAGIVLQGEWFRSEGAPVKRGDTLYEIAPLDRMTVEVHLTTEDLSEIEVGDTVTVRVDSALGTAWRGNISRIDPRAAIIEEKVCFVADVDVSNEENLLRPGMKGNARISTGFKSIGWLVFHRPYRWMMKQLVW